MWTTEVGATQILKGTGCAGGNVLCTKVDEVPLEWDSNV
jgi:hypothetical protein